jgi:hypothetical protein
MKLLPPRTTYISTGDIRVPSTSQISGRQNNNDDVRPLSSRSSSLIYPKEQKTRFAKRPCGSKKRRTDIYRDGTDDPVTAADLPALPPPPSKRPHLADQRPPLLLLLLTIIPADLLDLTPAHDGRSALHMA